MGREQPSIRDRAAPWQPRLWAILVGLAALVAYLVAFVAKNDGEVELDFVFFTARAGLIWLLLLGFAAGILAGVLLSQLYRRHSGNGAR
jgi:uncharacterized integral membrane protein